MAKLTIKQATHWLSEAWGQEIKARDVKLRGECDLWAETWSSITLEKSPFSATPEIMALTVATLDKEIAKHIVEMGH